MSSNTESILAKKQGRPFQYVQEKTRKDDLAKEIAKRDKIEDGLIVVFSVLEPCGLFHFDSKRQIACAVGPAMPVSIFLFYGPGLRSDSPPAPNLSFSL